MSSPSSVNPAFEKAFEQVKVLVANFKKGKPEDWSEAQARTDFIDKFWSALGWDVNHELQTNPYEQEVHIERSVIESGRSRRADYAFLAPNFRDVRFFVEAKRPGPELDNPDDCFQVVRYGWNSNVPLSVLTNFQYFRVLDCRYRPDIDSATQRVIEELSFHFTDYSDREKFARIYYLFSRESVATDSLQKYAETLPRAKGKASQRGLFPSGKLQDIDDSFLEELDQFRESLAKSFKRRNPQLDGEELTEATQRTLDRLVFMRFLEDKLIESEAMVEGFGSRGTAWQDFVATSRTLDATYNGIIFKKHSLLDASTFKVDEEVFEDIREKLAHTNSPYAFHYIPIHILGSIYERFLGKTIIATAKQARVEEKPEVRKAGGVYYTPEYIVRYIVGNTVGKLIADKSPEQIAGMHFADIACGSGSFLLGVYDTLLRRHAAYYNERKNRSQAKKDGCIVGDDGKLHLTLAQKRKILTNNIYGVDLDQQAVEVAQLSLYLKLLEEETTASVRHHQLEFGEKLLPDLKNNIICGNSLVDWDISKKSLFGSEIEPEEEVRLKPMDFADAFPHVMKNHKFDAIVGNPPWLMAGYYLESSLQYLRSKFSTASGKFDLYYTFVEQALRLVATGGAVGLIVPNKFMHTRAAFELRDLLSSGKFLDTIIDFGDEQIFDGATNYSSIILLHKSEHPRVNVKKAARGLSFSAQFIVDSSNFSAQPWRLEDSTKSALLEKISASGERLESITARFGTGVQSGADRILTIQENLVRVSGFEKDLLKPILRGRDVRAYHVARDTKMLIFPYRGGDSSFTVLPESALKKYSNVYHLLKRNKEKLSERIWFGKNAEELSGQWYGMMYVDSPWSFSQPHLLTPSLSNRSNFAIGTGALFMTGTAGVTSVIPKPEYKEGLKFLLGLLNSTLLTYYITSHSPIFSGGYFKFSAPYLKQIPIRRINFSEKGDTKKHSEIVELVEKIISAKEQGDRARTDRERDHLDRKCVALRHDIDQIVYELYDLTPDEIAQVETRTSKSV